MTEKIGQENRGWREANLVMVPLIEVLPVFGRVSLVLKIIHARNRIARAEAAEEENSTVAGAAS